MTEGRPEALARLDIFVGEWAHEAQFPGGHPAPPSADAEGPLVVSRFDWELDGHYLVGRTDVRIPGLHNGLTIVSVDAETGGYVQHYYDSRGVTRLYAMSFADGTWRLLRETADFSPLEFQQRFIGRFSEDGNTISGAWEKRVPDAGWELDFGLTYRRIG